MREEVPVRHQEVRPVALHAYSDALDSDDDGGSTVLPPSDEYDFDVEVEQGIITDDEHLGAVDSEPNLPSSYTDTFTVPPLMSWVACEGQQCLCQAFSQVRGNGL